MNENRKTFRLSEKAQEILDQYRENNRTTGGWNWETPKTLTENNALNQILESHPQIKRLREQLEEEQKKVSELSRLNGQYAGLMLELRRLMGVVPQSEMAEKMAQLKEEILTEIRETDSKNEPAAAPGPAKKTAKRVKDLVQGTKK